MGRWPHCPVDAIYKAIVRTKMDYGAFLFGSAATTHLNKFDVIQNQAMSRRTEVLQESPLSSTLFLIAIDDHPEKIFHTV